ncbi:AAEL009498-PA [Aedes aegypti]|uniref:AAEL009498-PA n=1 Tax=Aedes aegypti TaxID=7159 RepID=Q0IEL6_AEDAE|nr:AAEL009498-PA [Aedes aegypti]
MEHSLVPPKPATAGSCVSYSRPDTPQPTVDLPQMSVPVNNMQSPIVRLK